MMARRVLVLPCLASIALLGLVFSAGVRTNPPSVWSIVAAAAGLLIWNALLAISAFARSRRLTLTPALRPPHYVQATSQAAVFLYWGWYWPPVYAQRPLIVAQLLFAYTFDMLLSWSRRDDYALGFGPFPIVFSINL